jgi:STE24 endopeptidase
MLNVKARWSPEDRRGGPADAATSWASESRHQHVAVGMRPIDAEMSARPHQPLVAIPGLDVRRAKRYSRVRLAFLLAGTGAKVAQLGWFALSGQSARLRDLSRARAPHPRLATPAYLAATSVASRLASLPLAYGRDVLVERRFGLTKRTTAGWIADQVKGLGVQLALAVPLGTAAFTVIRARPRDWWLVLATATVPVTVALSHAAPVLILPLFNRFEPLANRDLEKRIERLAGRAGVHVADIYRMDMSRQTEKPNAFFMGLGRTKRIVLADTLLDRFPDDEVEAIVAHELGHQVHGDIWRFLALGSALGFGAAYAVHRVAPPLVRRMAARTGVHSVDDVAALPLLGLVLTVAGLVAAPIGAAASRAIERRADRYAVRLTTNGRAFASALSRLAAVSLVDPDPSPLVVFFLHSHPPIARRIAEAQEFAPKSNE